MAHVARGGAIRTTIDAADGAECATAKCPSGLQGKSDGAQRGIHVSAVGVYARARARNGRTAGLRDDAVVCLALGCEQRRRIERCAEEVERGCVKADDGEIVDGRDKGARAKAARVALELQRADETPQTDIVIARDEQPLHVGVLGKNVIKPRGLGIPSARTHA